MDEVVGRYRYPGTYNWIDVSMSSACLKNVFYVIFYFILNVQDGTVGIL